MIATRSIRKILLGAFLLLMVPLYAFSGDWSVTPITLDLGRDAKSGILNVSNKASEKLSVQMKLMEWTQDAEGKDVYTDSSDLIFFPKIMTIDAKEERVIRVGLKSPAIGKEKAYRLYIEEIPEPKKEEGSRVSIAFRFGVPVFVKPVKEEQKGELAKISLANGVLNGVVRNTGNVHFKAALTVKGTDAGGAETLAAEQSGWYVLPGATRTIPATLQKEACGKTSRVSVEVKTEKFSLNGKLDVDKAMCIP